MKKTIHSDHGAIIAGLLTELRNQAGMTQRELATKLDVAHALVANWELGERRVDLAEFYWICEACGASAESEASKLIQAFAKLET